MPKNLNLFGKYLRRLGKSHKKGFKKKQIIHPIPVKAYGRVPSAASQTGLYHDEDYNYYTKVSYSLKKTRIKIKPNVFKKHIVSNILNTIIPSVRITTSALHAIDDAGGFDNYILRTPPEELRSNFGEKLRNVMYFYLSHPNVRTFTLPWKIFMSRFQQSDYYYAIFQHLKKKRLYELYKNKESGKYSPYYLPNDKSLHPQRQQFPINTEITGLNLWYNKNKILKKAFVDKLKEAKSFDQAYTDHHFIGSYRKGRGRGGGGKHGRTPRKRSKTYKYFEIRPY
ncbi:mitochondrial ribosomal protein L28 precursor, putative [Plasmodium vinckei]|uniref:Mitochondrial ribosomal protein L28, putative n=2 Tax=Plasmodium vinckei TaxID=5860 RepID=A0A6V7SR94_PLAVN|nr:mitochondrial ribosomal protein L28 precursor, putative [Plasmodium vinckei lentum]CAD2111461.1 mitochondrial ribosomal protein L28 precursor, putative [Plasmodium vinckei]